MTRVNIIQFLRLCFARLLKGIIVLYRTTLKPFLPPACRFYPTCSEYAIQAIDMHGPVNGAWLALKRILRCHPWNPGGYDPVPSPRSLDSLPDEETAHEV